MYKFIIRKISEFQKWVKDSFKPPTLKGGLYADLISWVYRISVRRWNALRVVFRWMCVVLFGKRSVSFILQKVRRVWWSFLHYFRTERDSYVYVVRQRFSTILRLYRKIITFFKKLKKFWFRTGSYWSKRVCLLYLFYLIWVFKHDIISIDAYTLVNFVKRYFNPHTHFYCYLIKIIFLFESPNLPFFTKIYYSSVLILVLFIENFIFCVCNTSLWLLSGFYQIEVQFLQNLFFLDLTLDRLGLNLTQKECSTTVPYKYILHMTFYTHMYIWLCTCLYYVILKRIFTKVDAFVRRSWKLLFKAEIHRFYRLCFLYTLFIALALVQAPDTVNICLHYLYVLFKRHLHQFPHLHQYLIEISYLFKSEERPFTINICYSFILVIVYIFENFIFCVYNTSIWLLSNLYPVKLNSPQNLVFLDFTFDWLGLEFPPGNSSRFRSSTYTSHIPPHVVFYTCGYLYLFRRIFSQMSFFFFKLKKFCGTVGIQKYHVFWFSSTLFLPPIYKLMPDIEEMYDVFFYIKHFIHQFPNIYCYWLEVSYLFQSKDRPFLLNLCYSFTLLIAFLLDNYIFCCYSAFAWITHTILNNGFIFPTRLFFLDLVTDWLDLEPNPKRLLVVDIFDYNLFVQIYTSWYSCIYVFTYFHFFFWILSKITIFLNKYRKFWFKTGAYWSPILCSLYTCYLLWVFRQDIAAMDIFILLDSLKRCFYQLSYFYNYVVELVNLVKSTSQLIFSSILPNLHLTVVWFLENFIFYGCCIGLWVEKIFLSIKVYFSENLGFIDPVLNWLGLGISQEHTSVNTPSVYPPMYIFIPPYTYMRPILDPFAYDPMLHPPYLYLHPYVPFHTFLTTHLYIFPCIPIYVPPYTPLYITLFIPTPPYLFSYTYPLNPLYTILPSPYIFWHPLHPPLYTFWQSPYPHTLLYTATPKPYPYVYITYIWTT